MSDSKKRFYMLRRFFFANGTAMFGDGTSKFYWIYSCIGRFIIYCNWFAMLVDAVTHLDDLARTIETVCMVIPLFCCIWIDTFVSLNKRSLQELIDLTDQFVWEDCPVRDEKSGWLTMAGLIPKIQPFIFHLRWTTVLPHSAYMIHRAIKSRDLLGMNAWFPFDTRISPVHEIIIVLQIYCSFMYTSNFHAIMGLYATLVAIACTQLQKVRDLFLRLENRHPENRKQFSRCIEFHQTVLSFMSMMQSKLNVLLFGHFMIIIIGMAFASFGFVMSWGNIGAVYTVFLVFVGQLLLLGTYCMFGSELTDRAEDVKFAAYSCDWVGSPISEQRSLMFVMASANSEFKLLAGGFIPATKETMLAMLNQTFSYAMFLLNFKDVD